ncbi:MAG: NfeD family protein [Bacteroidales bacterium]
MKGNQLFRILAVALLLQQAAVLQPIRAEYAGEAGEPTRIFVFSMNQQVDKGLWRITRSAFDEAEDWNADVVLIRMNTYGGLVDMADSIRTKILYYPKPVWVFIDNNAASAGSLISIACDRIYMRPGANIGAATVVDQTGGVVPDKYQSYMRSTMRSTAEAQGKDTIISSRGDTIFKWKRDPKIAEAMVDPSVYIAGLVDTGKVLTMTTQEAMRWGFCEGEAASVEELVKMSGVGEYVIKEHKLTGMEKFIAFLLSPAIQGILILLIIGGIYFELQTPGIGFPLIAAIIGALFYFAPLYLDGLAEHWEILLFIVGIVLLLVEIFALPGFGVAGISGIVLIITGLSLSLIENVVFDFSQVNFGKAVRSFAYVTLLVFVGLIGSIWISSKLFTSSPFAWLALKRTANSADGFVGAPVEMRLLVGQEGEAYSVLRPSGKVMVNGKVYDAVADTSWIEKGSRVLVVKHETTQIYVKKV